MSMLLPSPKDSFLAPANPELTVAYYDRIPTSELAAIFAHKNKARNETKHKKGIPVQSVYVLHDGTKIQGAILAEAMLEPRFLLMPEGPFLDIQIPWPSLQVWANARCEFLKQKVSLNCISQYASAMTNLIATMDVYDEAFFPLLTFSEEWDAPTLPIRRKMVQHLLDSGFHTSLPNRRAMQGMS
jgi:hypothetical protein